MNYYSGATNSNINAATIAATAFVATVAIKQGKVTTLIVDMQNAMINTINIATQQL
ncbi:MAG: hypothetical protein MJ237_08530 [bacterium]|nr:hypothetical protein [bacterium]